MDNVTALLMEGSSSGGDLAEVVVEGSAVTITPERDHIYKCGVLTSLTITNPPAAGRWGIVFFSGATATQTVIPETVQWKDEDFSAEQNKRYEINVWDSYALHVGWDYEGVAP